MTNKTEVVWHQHAVDKAARAVLKSQKPCVIWFTGLSGSGKSTTASALEQKLFELGQHTYLLDGDNVRHGLNQDLGFSDEDRIENIRRIGETAKLFVDAGLIVIAAFISPFQKQRERIRSMVAEQEFIEIYMNTSLAICEARDSKGLYKKARLGEIKHFTGIDSDYEIPDNAELVLDTAQLTTEECVEHILQYLVQTGYLDAQC